MVSLNPNDNYSYCPHWFFDQDNSLGIIAGEWRSKAKISLELLDDIEHLGSSNYSKNAKEARASLIKKAKFWEGNDSIENLMVFFASAVFCDTDFVI